MNSKITEKIKSDEILSKLTGNFQNEIYLVGGSVRDYFMDIESHDRDLIVIDEDAREYSQKAAEYLNATFVPLDEENKIYRLVMPNKIDYLDITNPIEGSLEKDLQRRDLTINSIAININTCEITDINDGINDIKNKLIKHIQEENFTDDPLRILRIFRFQAKLGFDINEDTANIVKKYKKLIHKPAVERINYELLNLFGGKYTSTALACMDKLGILEEIFPFVKELKQVPPNTHHHLRLFEHCIETVRQIQDIYENSSDEIKLHLEKQDFGGNSRLAHLKLSGFMHDIGKFLTWTIEGDRHRFIKHDDIGAKIAKQILKEMHFSNKQIEYITLMIKNHIYPSSVISSPEISDKVMMRYLRKMGENSSDAIILAKADRLSARGPLITDEIIKNNIEGLNKLLNFCLHNLKTLEPLPILLDGNEIMSILNIKPSKELGDILDKLHEAQISGDILTKEHALNFIKKIKNL